MKFILAINSSGSTGLVFFFFFYFLRYLDHYALYFLLSTENLYFFQKKKIFFWTVWPKMAVMGVVTYAVELKPDYRLAFKMC